MSFPRVPSPLLVLTAALVGASGALCGACGAGGPRPGEPQPALAESVRAQASFRALQEAWLDQVRDDDIDPKAERRQLRNLEQGFRDFLRRHPKDDQARVARIYLAWLLARTGRLGEAEQVLRPTLQGPEGAPRDLATVARASVLLARGQAREAVELLEPLRGKIIDRTELFVFEDLLVRAALAGRAWRRATDAMVTWLEEAPPELQGAVRSAVRQRLKKVPLLVQERQLEALNERRRSGDGSPELAWLRPQLLERLIAAALTNEDPELARRLLDANPEIRRGDQGQALMRLAARIEVAPRVAGRAVGFVASVGDRKTRRRSAAVLRGLMRTLGLPAAAARPEAPQLLTRAERGTPESMRRALRGLAGDGATLLIAGLDEEGAQIAVDHASRTKIPVLLLHMPRLRHLGSHGFLVDAGEGKGPLEAALDARELRSVQYVGGAAVPCDRPLAAAGKARFPVGTWARQSVEALLFLGPVRCSERAAREALAAGLRPTLAFGLHSAPLAVDGWPVPVLGVAAGDYPLGSSPRPPATMERWRDVDGQAPGWFTAIGHDAALLASSVLSTMPLSRTDDSAAVRKLHDRARRRLGRVEVALWTTRARGFAGRQMLPRDLRVYRREPGK